MTHQTTLFSSSIASPHIHSGGGVGQTMFRVQIALVPATLFSFWLFGWPAMNLWLVTVLSALLAEGVCLKLFGKPVNPALMDGSAILTAWLLVLSLPPWAPWWIGSLGGVMAIVIGKQIYGGIGQNVFNPAMVARAILLVSFPIPMTQWAHPTPIHLLAAPDFWEGLRITFLSAPIPDTMTTASLLGYTKTELSRHVDLLHSLPAFSEHGFSSLSGQRPGSLGETSAWLLLGGGIFLMIMGIIRWHIPVAFLAGLGIPALIAHHIDPARYLDVWTHILSGGTILGAFFIATDYVTSPNTSLGQIIFGVGIGFLTFVIRTWGGYPEGLAFAVLLMNALTPVIDRFCKPRIFGRERNGNPLELKARS